MMKSYRDAKKILCPLFSSEVLAATFWGLMSMSSYLLLIWPRQNLSYFTQEQRFPLICFAVFSVILILQSYLNVRCGAGEFSPGRSEKNAIYPVDPASYRSPHGLIELFLHPLVLLFPFFPFLIVSTALSGASFVVFGKAISLIMMASILCRLVGFTIYLFQGKTRWIGWTGRLFLKIILFWFLFVAIVFGRSVNPMRMFAWFDTGLQQIGVMLIGSYGLTMKGGSMGILLLVVGDLLVIARKVKESL